MASLGSRGVGLTGQPLTLQCLENHGPQHPSMNIPGDSYVVPFLILTCFLIREYHILPKTELDRSLQVPHIHQSFKLRHPEHRAHARLL